MTTPLPPEIVLSLSIDQSSVPGMSSCAVASELEAERTRKRARKATAKERNILRGCRLSKQRKERDLVEREKKTKRGKVSIDHFRLY